MSQAQKVSPKNDDGDNLSAPDTAADIAVTPDQVNEFAASAQKKVELDLEDAPFLNEEPEEKEQSTEQEQESSEPAEANTESAAPKKKKKLFIIGGIAALLLLLIGGAVFYFFFYDDEILPNIIVVENPEVQAPPKTFELKLDPFVIQCIDHNGKIHFVKGSFILSTIHNEVFFEISNNQKVIRDAIYYYLGIQDPDVLLNPVNHQLIKDGLFETVNKYVMSGSIDHLYIDSLLIY